MAIVKKTPDGKTVPISEAELSAAIKMMKGNLESYAAFLDHRIKDQMKDSRVDFSGDPNGNLRVKAVRLFEDAAKHLEEKYRNLYTDQNVTIDIEELLGNEIPEIDKKIFESRSYNDRFAQELIAVTETSNNNEFLYNFAWDGAPEKKYSKVDPFSEENYKKTSESIRVPETEVFDGIDTIAEFDPDKDTGLVAFKERQGNSATLKDTEVKQDFDAAIRSKKVQLYGPDGQSGLCEQIAGYQRQIAAIEQKDTVPPNLRDSLTLEQYKRAQINNVKMDLLPALKRKNELEHDLEKTELAKNQALYGTAGFGAAVALTGMRASKLKAAKEVTVEDLFDTLSQINEYTRTEQGPKGGAIRGHIVHYRNKPMLNEYVYGVEPGRASLFLYRTLNHVASEMNRIKEIENPKERKSQAIGLAAYTYQMLILEHVFHDANGRTSRLFMDTILQTFGMPPHIPDSKDSNMSIEFGSELNKDYAEHVFRGVQKSSEMLLKRKAKIAEEQKRHHMKEIEALTALTSTQVDLLEEQREQAHKIRGTLNSDAYNKFEAALAAKAELAKILMEGKKLGIESVNLKQLSKETRKTIAQVMDTEKFPSSMSFDDYAGMYRKVDEAVLRSAHKYIKYKYADHTDDVKKEPKLKALSEDDKRKLKLISKVVSPEKYQVMKAACLNTGKHAHQKAMKAMGTGSLARH